MPDNQPDDAGGPGDTSSRGAPSEVDGVEAELLGAFARLAPAGSHRFNFEESMSRLDPQPPPDRRAVLPPWGGLPGDLWPEGARPRWASA